MYVVTGGAGFIGSNIVAALTEKTDQRVVVSDRLRDGDKWRNIAKHEVRYVVHPDDLLDFLESAAFGIRGIIHMGAISATTETDVDKIVENNLRLSQRLWTWCAKRQVRFIYASSAATYGDGEGGFKDDSDINDLGRLRPLNPYGWSKNLFDRFVSRLIQEGGPRPPQWVGLKFFNVYGPNEYHKGSMRSVVHQVFPRAKAGLPAKLFESHKKGYDHGGQLRDFIYVRDCVNVIEWFLRHENHTSGLFNCGTGKARSFSDLAGAVFKALGKEPNIEYVSMPEELQGRYQYFTEADMTKLKNAGYDQPFTTLEDGVADYVRNYLDADDPYR